MKPKDFSLEYLYKDYKVQQQEDKMQAPSPVSDAVILFSRPILESLKKSKDKQAHVHDLARETKINIKDMFQVIAALEAAGLVDVIEKDEITGNDLIKLTEKGEERIS